MSLLQSINYFVKFIQVTSYWGAAIRPYVADEIFERSLK
jgi:hypothetical protein